MSWAASTSPALTLRNSIQLQEPIRSFNHLPGGGGVDYADDRDRYRGDLISIHCWRVRPSSMEGLGIPAVCRTLGLLRPRFVACRTGYVVARRDAIHVVGEPAVQRPRSAVHRLSRRTCAPDRTSRQEKKAGSSDGSSAGTWHFCISPSTAIAGELLDSATSVLWAGSVDGGQRGLSSTADAATIFRQAR